MKMPLHPPLHLNFFFNLHTPNSKTFCRDREVGFDGRSAGPAISHQDREWEVGFEDS